MNKHTHRHKLINFIFIMHTSTRSIKWCISALHPHCLYPIYNTINTHSIHIQFIFSLFLLSMKYICKALFIYFFGFLHAH